MFQPNTGNTGTPSQSHDFITDLKNWWGTCPLFTRFLIFFCSGLCILALFSSLPQMLVNQPAKTIGSFQITRLIFSPFAFFTIAEILFAFVAYLPISATEEKEGGTLLAVVNFFIKNLEINLIFIVLCYILSIISDYFLTFEAYGLWCIFFAGVVERCIEHPDGTTGLLLSSFQIQNKIYPLILVLLFSIVSNVIRLDMLAAALSAFLNFKFLNHYHHELLNDERLARWESSSVVAWLRTLPNYVAHGSMSGPLISSSEKGGSPNYPPIGDFGTSLNTNTQFGNSFGSSGIMIGSDANKGTDNTGKNNYVQGQRDFVDLESDHDLQ